MKVYVITAGEYSDYCIQAVTLNREKAELICAINNRNIRYSEDQSKIEEYDTDEIQCESIGDVGICYTAKFDYKVLLTMFVSAGRITSAGKNQLIQYPELTYLITIASQQD